MKPQLIILSAFLSPFRSGAEACAEEVALRLCDRYDITIVTARMHRDHPKKDLWKGKIKVVRVGSAFRFNKWLFPFIAPFIVRSCVGARRWRAREDTMLPQGAPAGRPYDPPIILHAVLETFAGLALYFCKFLIPGAYRILTLQTLNRSFLKCPIIRSAHAVTAISTPLKKIAEDCGAEDITLIPNGIDMSRVFTLGKDSGRILFVGRLEKMKGVDTLLRAFARVKGEGVHLRIVGDGSQRSVLEALAEELGIAERVTFVGYVPVERVYEEFAKAQIFCGLSRSEALGNVFLEAQAEGCAVIGTNVGGIPDIVEDGITGILVPPDDADAAARALRRFVDDAIFRKQCAENGKNLAKRYEWSGISLMYEKIYKNACVLLNEQ